MNHAAKSLFCWIISVLTVIVLSACGKDLSRDAAAALIRSEKQETKTAYLSVVLGKDRYSDTIDGAIPKVLDALVSSGFLSKEERSYYPGDPAAGRYPGQRSFAPHSYWQWSPTAKLTPYMINEESIPGNIRVKIATEQLVSVDGLAKQSDSLIKVEYSMKWEPNEVGAVLIPDALLLAINVPPPRKATIFVQKFDDGWRIVR